MGNKSFKGYNEEQQNQPHESPLLMFPNYHNPEFPINFKGFFNPSSKSIDCLYLPQLQDKTICGSSLGWLIVFDQTTSNISLINPLNRTQIHLPKLPSQSQKNQPQIVYKAVLSSNPITNPLNYIVLAIYGERKKLIYCQPNRNSWTTLEETGASYDDIISDSGEFYVVNEFGKIMLLNFDFSHVGSPPIVKEVAIPWFFNADKVYVVIIGKQLCLVKRFLQDNPKLGYQTYFFEVYVYVPCYETWSYVKSTGNWTILLGINQSVSIPPSNGGNFKGNCIYFTDDRLDIKARGGFGGRDFGVFCLEDNNEGTSSRPMYLWDCPPWTIWFSPS